MASRDEIIALVVAKAHEHGLVPYELLGGVIAESGLNPDAERYGVWPDVSFGLLQQTVKFAEEGDHTPSPENVALIRRLYSDPAHALDVGAAKFKHWRYDPEVSALQAWTAYNLPASYRFWPDVPNVEQRENYRAGLAEAQRILGAPPVEPASPVYNPEQPAFTQNDDWSCAPTSTRWALWAWGRQPSEQWIESTMKADHIVSEARGLLDASGASLAAWITEQYGDFGYTARNASPVTFDDVRSLAGSAPVLIGGRNWGAAGHWTGVRSYDPSKGVLVLANPGGSGPIYGQQSLDRQQFVERGSWSLVVITHASQGTPVPTPPPTDSATELAQLRAEVESLRRDLASANTRLGVASTDYVRGLRDLANAYEALKPGG